MKAAKIATLAALLLITGYFAVGAFIKLRSDQTVLDSASVAEAQTFRAPSTTVPMPQVSGALEQMPPSQVDGMFAPEKKAQ